jgi:hypothetical protein
MCTMSASICTSAKENKDKVGNQLLIHVDDDDKFEIECSGYY